MSATTHNTGAQAALLAWLKDRPAGATNAEIAASPNAAAAFKHLGVYLTRLVRSGDIGYTVGRRPSGRGRPLWRYFAREHCPYGAILAAKREPKPAKPPRVAAPKPEKAPRPTKPPRPPKPAKVAKPPRPKKAPKPPKPPKPPKVAKPRVASRKAAPPLALPGAERFCGAIKPPPALKATEAFKVAKADDSRAITTVWQPRPDPRSIGKPEPFFAAGHHKRLEPRPWVAAITRGAR